MLNTDIYGTKIKANDIILYTFNKGKDDEEVNIWLVQRVKEKDVSLIREGRFLKLTHIVPESCVKLGNITYNHDLVPYLWRNDFKIKTYYIQKHYTFKEPKTAVIRSINEDNALDQAAHLEENKNKHQMPYLFEVKKRSK